MVFIKKKKVYNSEIIIDTLIIYNKQTSSSGQIVVQGKPKQAVSTYMKIYSFWPVST